MTVFMLEIAAVTLTMSAVILIALLMLRLFGKRFSAKCRYIVWAVILLRLCIPVGVFSLPRLFTFEIPRASEMTENEMPSEKPDNELYVPAETNVQNEISAPESVDKEISVTPIAPETAAPIPSFPEIAESGDTVYDIAEITEKEPEKNTFAFPTADEILRLLFVIWLSGAAIFFAFNFASSYISTIKLTRLKKQCAEDTVSLYGRICKRHGIKRAPKLYRCSEIGSPMLCGYINPSILLPDYDLTPNSAVGILSHEIIHYKRRDLYVKLMCLLALSLNWFNPLVHIAAKRCAAEMELSCDEAVLLGLDEDARRSYGNVMLDIIKRCRRMENPLTTQFNPKKSAVKERFLNILDVTVKKNGKFIVVLAVICCLVSGMVIGCSTEKNGEDETENEASIGFVVTAERLDASCFEGEDINEITEIELGENVKEIDFAYLNTFPKLRKINIENNENFKFVESEYVERGAFLASLNSPELLYLNPDNTTLFLDTEAAEFFEPRENISVYTCGAVLSAYYEDEPDDDITVYWFLEKAEYDGAIKSITGKDGARLQVNGGDKVLQAVRADGIFVLSVGRHEWLHSMLFKDGEIVEFHPEYTETDYIPEGTNGCTFFADKEGRLCYRETAYKMVSIQTDYWFVNYLKSREEFWREEGYAEIRGTDYKYVYFDPQKTYTARDWFEEQGLTMDLWFGDLSDEIKGEADTLDKLLEAQKPVEERMPDIFYPIRFNVNNYKKAPDDVKNGVYTGYYMNYPFTCEYYENSPVYKFEMEVPQLVSEKSGAKELNEYIFGYYMCRYQDIFMQYAKKNDANRMGTHSLDLSYNVFTYGSVVIISVRSISSIIGTGAQAYKYDVYYYDSESDKVLTDDDMIKLLSDGKESLTSLLTLLNQPDNLLNVMYSSDPRFWADESSIYGVLPAEEGGMYIIYQPYYIEAIRARGLFWKDGAFSSVPEGKLNGISEPPIPEGIDEKYVVHDLGKLHDLILEHYAFSFINAFVGGYTNTLEEMANLPKGTYDSYNSIKLLDWRAWPEKDENENVNVYFQLLPEESEVSAFKAGEWSDIYLISEGIFGTSMINTSKESLSGTETLEERALLTLFDKTGMCEIPKTNNMDSGKNFAVTCYLCSLDSGGEGMTLDEIRDLAEKVFGIKNFTPQSHMYEGKYAELGHGASGFSYQIIERERQEDGSMSITVQTYADYAKTVESDSYRYIIKKHDGYIEFVSFEKIYDSKFKILSWSL